MNNKLPQHLQKQIEELAEKIRNEPLSGGCNVMDFTAGAAALYNLAMTKTIDLPDDTFLKQFVEDFKPFVDKIAEQKAQLKACKAEIEAMRLEIESYKFMDENKDLFKKLAKQELIDELKAENAELKLEIKRLQDKIHNERRILNEQSTALLNTKNTEIDSLKAEIEAFKAELESWYENEEK